MILPPFLQILSPIQINSLTVYSNKAMTQHKLMPCIIKHTLPSTADEKIILPLSLPNMMILSFTMLPIIRLTQIWNYFSSFFVSIFYNQKIDQPYLTLKMKKGGLVDINRLIVAFRNPKKLRNLLFPRKLEQGSGFHISSFC